MKKIVAIVFSILLTFAAFSGLSVSAIADNEAKAKLKTSRSTYILGEEVVVTLNLNCGTDIESFNLYVGFDKNVFEWVSEGTSHISGVSGAFRQYDQTGGAQSRIRLGYTYENAGTMLGANSAGVISLTFRVKDNAPAGTTSFSVANAYVAPVAADNQLGPVVNKNGSVCTTTYASAQVTIPSGVSVQNDRSEEHTSELQS